LPTAPAPPWARPGLRHCQPGSPAAAAARDAADIALTVVDAWQGRGVGLTLARELLRRRPPGITRLVTTVSADNAPALALLSRLGTGIRRPDSRGTYEVTVELPAETTAPGGDQPG
jgi:RimJ/RimL family protein N-acetyltransferase